MCLCTYSDAKWKMGKKHTKRKQKQGQLIFQRVSNARLFTSNEGRVQNAPFTIDLYRQGIKKPSFMQDFDFKCQVSQSIWFWLLQVFVMQEDCHKM